MKIGVVSLVSDVHDPRSLDRVSAPIINALKESFDLEEIETGDLARVDLPLVFIKTGGTEHKFVNIAPMLEKTGKPVTLLAGDSNNSLPAALEILSWANMKGLKNCLLLHGSIEVLKKKLAKRIADVKLMDTLKSTVIGLLGKPSDWLIASDVDYKQVKERWGVSIVEIEMEEVTGNIDKFSESGAIEIQSAFPNAQFKEGVTLKNIADAVKIYMGIKKTISDYGLSALTLRCFDLLTPLNNTGCLALARLNDEGIPAGCEGDIPALFTMIIDRLITGKPSFMANPSLIEDDRVTLAHCTIPMSIVESFGFKTHFESGIGVAVAGKLKEGPVTISKIGGPALDRFYVDKGTLTENTESEALCRTQIVVKPAHGTDYFLSTPLGNHHVISEGNHTERFIEVMSLTAARPAADFA
jgi:L-fucose isomerase-like protein